MKPAGSVWICNGRIDDDTLVVPSYPRAFLKDKVLIKEGFTPFFQMGERLPIICLQENSLLAEGYQPLRSRPAQHLPDWLKKPTFNDFILPGARDFWVGIHSIRGRYLFVAGLDPVEPFVNWAVGTYTTMCLDVDDAIEHLEPKYHLKTISVWERLRKGGLDIGVLAPHEEVPCSDDLGASRVRRTRLRDRS